MKTTILIATTALFFGAPLVHSQEPKSPAAMMPKPVAEHEWLKKLVGQWETTTECSIEPGKPPGKGSGTETVRGLGGFWVIAEGKAEMMGNPMQYIMTLGYDPKAGEYVGTWVDSMTGMLWKYTGSVDDTGRILALESEGGCPMNPGHVTKFRDVTEFKSDDHRTFSSSMLGEDGKWVTMARGEARRKK
jgi:hypothetical protein